MPFFSELSVLQHLLGLAQIDDVSNSLDQAEDEDDSTENDIQVSLGILDPYGLNEIGDGT